MMKKLVRKEGEPASRLAARSMLAPPHMSAEDHVEGLSQMSVLNTDWSFLTVCGIRARSS